MAVRRRRLHLPVLLLGLIALLLGGFALWQGSLFRQCGFFDRTFETSGCVARLTPDGWHPPALGGIAWPTPEALVLFDNVGSGSGSQQQGDGTPTFDN